MGALLVVGCEYGKPGPGVVVPGSSEPARPGGLAHPVLFGNESTSRPVSRVLSGCPSREGRPRRPFIWGAGCPAPRATNPGGGPEDGLRVPGLPARRPPLFGLAPGGVYRAAPVARRAVRSYRTVSPLPA